MFFMALHETMTLLGIEDNCRERHKNVIIRNIIILSVLSFIFITISYELMLEANKKFY